MIKENNIGPLLFSLLMMGFFCAFLVKFSFAQETSFSIGPTLIEIEASKPSNISKNFSLKNLSDQPLQLTLELIPFTQAQKQSGQTELIFDRTRQQDTWRFLSKNVQIVTEDQEIKSLTLSGQQEKTLTLVINIDKNEKTRDHYFSIVFIKQSESTPEQNKQSAMSEILPGLTSNVILSISSLEKRSGIIEEYSSPFFVDKGPVPFTVAVKNNASKYIKPYGNIVIKNMFGQTIGKVDLQPVIILSQTTRNIPNLEVKDSSENAKIRKTYSTKKVNAYWSESILLGPYSAQINLIISPDSKAITKTIYFIGFPVTILIALSLCLFILFFIIRKIKERRLITR